MAMPSMSATGGAAGPATSGAQGGGNNATFTGNGLVIDKGTTSVWVWVVLIVFAVVMLLMAL